MTPEKRSGGVGDTRLEVLPVPTPDEAAAIIAAVTTVKRRATTPNITGPSGWHVAARREGLHVGLTASRDGWRLAALLET